MLAFQYQTAVQRYDIGSSTALKFQYFNLSLFRIFASAYHRDHSFFKKDQRIFRIRRDPHHRLLFSLFYVILDTAASPFFIGTKDYPDPAV